MHDSAGQGDLWAGAARTRVWENVDAAKFHAEIAPLNRPAILKGLGARWPAVAEAKRSPQALAAYVKRFANQTPLEAFVGAPEIAGRFSYGADVRSFNFEKRQTNVAGLLDDLVASLNQPNAPALYAGAINVPKYMPGFGAENAHALLDASVEQLVSLWVGNRTRTAAHWDLPQNVACVISGRRRYTLLPTDQIANLYVGPLDFTIAGRATSLVDFHAPDFERFPRFREAMAHAEIADLEPGDAVYVPSLWFHHVESFDPLSMMLNFWWRDGPAHLISPQFTLMHALLTLRDLPENERAAWRTLFDHYIFQTGGEPLAHIPEAARGLFGEMTPEKLMRLKDFLAQSLRR